jgi:penicillin-binding protein-related factor A (putative recombinase)
MPTIKRILAGRKAKARGDIFENTFRSAAHRAHFKCIQIPMGAKQVARNKMIRVRTPFDFVLIHRKGAVFLDTKITLKKSFSFSDCTPHQIKELMEIEKLGHLAGYVVYYSELNRIVFYHSYKLVRLQIGKSVKPEDGVSLGSLQDLSLVSVLNQWIARDQAGIRTVTTSRDSEPCLESSPAADTQAQE